MARGGKRAGAGRPIGSTSRPRILDFFTEEDIEKFAQHIKSSYKTSDKIASWVGDQIFHKAPQAIEVSGKDGGAIETRNPTLETIIAQKTAEALKEKKT